METIPKALTDTFDSDYCRRTDRIFMVGVGWYESGEFYYVSFVSPSLDSKGERDLIRQVQSFIPPDSVLVHWGGYDRIQWKQALGRHRLLDSEVEWVDSKEPMGVDQHAWFDLQRLFQTLPVLINRCSYKGLKKAAQAMVEAGLMSAPWGALGIRDGQQCAAAAYHWYRNPTVEFPQSIRNYNQADCRAMADMVQVLLREDDDRNERT
jgi:hypothetical protein